MLNMRAMFLALHPLLFPQDPTTGALVRIKTGGQLEEHLQRRFGIMGPDFFKMVSTDFELEQEGKIIDQLPPERLAQLATKLGRSVERVFLERGELETWIQDLGESTLNVATVIAPASTVRMAHVQIYRSHKHEQKGR